MKRARIGEASAAAASSSSSGEHKDVSPIEVVFQKHVRRSLLMYEVSIDFPLFSHGCCTCSTIRSSNDTFVE
jgi:hypothetical protein